MHIKSKDELQGILQTWTDGFFHRHKRPVSYDVLISSIQKLQAEKEQQYITNQFSTLNFEELSSIVDILRNNPNAYNLSHDSSKKKSSKPKKEST